MFGISSIRDMTGWEFWIILTMLAIQTLTCWRVLKMMGVHNALADYVEELDEQLKCESKRIGDLEHESRERAHNEATKSTN